MADSSIIDRDAQWADFQLDPRLMKAISQDMGWERPTLVQSQAVKLALNGKDILARARTGSGKTGAYIIPILQQLLREKENGEYTPGVKVLVLVPTHELCIQVIAVLAGLTKYCANLFSYLQLAADQSIDIQRPRLAELPDIVVATPGRLVEHLKKGHISVTKTLKFLVIDEADLILSYGYKGDIETIVQKLPKICQGFLMSATLDDDVENLKRLVLHTPAILKLEEDTSLATKLQQYVIFCPQKDKFLLIYVMLKLKLISGKMIVFVNEIDQAFRLKLFLERFSIKSAVLNSELPHNSRYHIVQEFNHGYFDILIATDEKSKYNKEDDEASAEDDQSGEENEAQEASDDNAAEDSDNDVENGSEGDNEDDDEDENDAEDDNEEMSEDNADHSGEEDEEQEESESGDDFDTALMSDVKKQLSKEEKKALRNKAKHDKLKAKKHSQKTESQDKEYGVTRGVDFKSVQIVINFDFPRTAKNYVHRIGRTARAGNAGVALSFVTDDDKQLLAQVQEDQEDEGRTIQPYEFKMAIVEGFRYRVEDVLRSVTGAHVKDARIQDIKLEILNSEKLKSHFEDNPRDLESLQHHRPLQASRVLTHLKFVPHYLLPQKKGESAGTKIHTEEPDEILGYNKNFRQFKRKLNAQSNPLLTLSRNSNKRKYSDAMQDQSYERTNIITDVNPNKKRKRFKKH